MFSIFFSRLDAYFQGKKQNKTKKEWFKTSSNAFEKNGIVLIIYWDFLEKLKKK